MTAEKERKISVVARNEDRLAEAFRRLDALLKRPRVPESAAIIPGISHARPLPRAGVIEALEAVNVATLLLRDARDALTHHPPP